MLQISIGHRRFCRTLCLSLSRDTLFQSSDCPLLSNVEQGQRRTQQKLSYVNHFCSLVKFLSSSVMISLKNIWFQLLPFCSQFRHLLLGHKFHIFPRRLLLSRSKQLLMDLWTQWMMIWPTKLLLIKLIYSVLTEFSSFCWQYISKLQMLAIRGTWVIGFVQLRF
uniref:ATM n=1 Tax=Arundo donax TaxID=35708 RepID=A0A0A9CZV2_ARUDO